MCKLHSFCVLYSTIEYYCLNVVLYKSINIYIGHESFAIGS